MIQPARRHVPAASFTNDASDIKSRWHLAARRSRGKYIVGLGVRRYWLSRADGTWQQAGHGAGGCEHVLDRVVAPDCEVEAGAAAEVVGLRHVVVRQLIPDALPALGFSACLDREDSSCSQAPTRPCTITAGRPHTRGAAGAPVLEWVRGNGHMGRLPLARGEPLESQPFCCGSENLGPEQGYEH
jgi:hypothetical protein